MEMWQNTTTLAWELNNYEIENVTIVEVAQWRVILDKVSTGIMTLNVINFMLGMGAAIYVREVWKHTKRPIGAVIGMVGQFLVLPAIGFCLCLAFNFRPYESLGVLMISCSPGGAFSNFFTFWLDGDLALSIMMTMCSSLIAFGGMPFNLWLYGNYWVSEDKTFVIPFTNIIVSLLFISVPVVVGMAVRHFHKRVAEIITRVSSIIGWLGVASAAIIWVILYWEVFVNASPLLYLAAIAFPILGFIFAFLLAKLACQNNMTGRTIGVETSSQNMPVALSIILLSFTGIEVRAELILFPTLYGVFLILEAIVFIVSFQLYKKLSKKDYPDLHRAHFEVIDPSEKVSFKV